MMVHRSLSQSQGQAPSPPIQGNDTVWFNQPLFNKSQVEGGREHEIRIVYPGTPANGQKQLQFLAIDYFYVFNDWVPGNGTSSEPTGEQRHESKPRGTIIGGVVGGVLCMIVVVWLVWYLSKRRKRQGNRVSAQSKLIVTPYTETADEPQQISVPLVQREVTSKQHRAQDSGIRYSGVAATLPPIYTPE